MAHTHACTLHYDGDRVGMFCEGRLVVVVVIIVAVVVVATAKEEAHVDDERMVINNTEPFFQKQKRM